VKTLLASIAAFVVWVVVLVFIGVVVGGGSQAGP